MTHALQALQYKTDQQSELRKIEGLNNRFFALTSQGPDAAGKNLTSTSGACTSMPLGCIGYRAACAEPAASPAPEADMIPAPKKQKAARRTKG